MRLENAQQAARDGLTSRPNEENRPDELLLLSLSPTQMVEEKTVKPAAPPAPTRARTLTNLFRSKSLRIISSSSSSSPGSSNRNSKGNNNHNHLSHNYNHHRSQRAQQQQQAATIDYLSTARPHKRSLSINRNHSTSFFGNSNSANQSADALSQKNFIASTGGGKLVLFLRRLFRTKRSNKQSAYKFGEENSENMRQSSSLDNSKIIINNIHTTTTTTTTTTPAPNDYKNFDNQGKQAPRRPLNLLSSPSSDSSASNSLIEILDCSPAVNQSRRALKEQHLVRERNRASWRMVQRSDSSLSELSDCSTTASEQLRRHLDEAYKRHRNCTSQREKEFIDSINVLRQASRHALPQSGRSSSKTRHAATKSVVSGKSDIETTSSLTDSQSTAGDDCSTNQVHQHQQQHQQPNCCICASYLDSVARLCPLAAATTYCPANASAACCPVLAPSISLPPPLPLSSQTNPADMCMCPLWRSMISNYSSGCQSADSPPLIFNPITTTTTATQSHHQPTSHLLLAQSPQTQHHHLQQQSQSQHQQQQHHNTTIDLKIEIGAELSKQAAIKLAGTNNSRRSFNASRKHHHHHHHQPKVVAEVDSLDSDYTTTTSTSNSS